MLIFFSVWSNPDSKIYEIIKYLLSTSPDNSRTWAINLRHISKMYGMEDPLSCLIRDPPSKSEYKEAVLTKILAFHEKELRNLAATNSKMNYLNVSLAGLRGKHHPSLSNLITTEEVRKLRPHLKILTGDYLTYQTKFEQTNQGNPLCRIYRYENETICHILAICPAFNSIRSRILYEMAEVCKTSISKVDFQLILENPETMTQFILDPTSFNLERRLNISDPIVTTMFPLSRDICYSIHKTRTKLLEELIKKWETVKQI